MKTAEFKPRDLVQSEDRCDSCGAEARVIATMLSGELLFCAHHARKAGQGLIDKAVHIHDPEGEMDLF